MKKSPPSPPGLPFLGQSRQFIRQPLSSFREWAGKYGDVVKLNFPGRTVVLVSEPELIKKIIEDDADFFSVGQAREDAFQEMEKNAMVVAKGDDWKRMRKIMQKYFTPDNVQGYAESVLEETDRLINGWEPGSTYELYDQMGTLTIRIVSSTLLGYDIKGEESIVKDAADAVIEQSDVTNAFRMVPEWVPLPQNLRLRRARGAIRDLIANL